MVVGVHPAYMPPCTTRVGVHPAVHAQYSTVRALHSTGASAVMTVIPGLLKREGTLRRKEALLHPENKPSSARKQALNGQQTRYRKPCCTRRSGMSQPLQSCHQTPLKVLACPFTRFTVGGYPGPWPPLSDISD